MCRFNEYAGFTWFSCHAGFVRLLLDGCYGRWFVYVKQRKATASCCAGGTCTLLRTSFVNRNTGRQSIRSGKYPRCSDLSLRGKNMHSMKARFVLIICKLSLGVVTLKHFLPKVSVMDPWDLPILVTGLEGVYPTISVKNLGAVIENYHL